MPDQCVHVLALTAGHLPWERALHPIHFLATHFWGKKTQKNQTTNLRCQGFNKTDIFHSHHPLRSAKGSQCRTTCSRPSLQPGAGAPPYHPGLDGADQTRELRAAENLRKSLAKPQSATEALERLPEKKLHGGLGKGLTLRVYNEILK